jgi:hypothetical protein
MDVPQSRRIKRRRTCCLLRSLIVPPSGRDLPSWKRWCNALAEARRPGLQSHELSNVFAQKPQHHLRHQHHQSPG